MLRRDKILLGITIGVAVLDAGVACAEYLKKKGIVIRDVLITAVDEKLYPRDETKEAKEITIE